MKRSYQFSTKRYDPQTGLSYYGYRFYAPDIGRWTTRNPLGEAGGINLYAYVGNNPASWVDPWGEEPVSLTVLALWGFAGTVGMTATTPAGQDAMEAFAEHVVHALKTFPQNAANVYEQLRDLFGPETLPIPEPLPTGAVNIPVDLTDVLAPEILYPGDRCPFEQPEQILPVDMPPLITVFPTEEGNPVFDPVMASGGRRGNQTTKDYLDQIRDEFLDANPGYDHVAGGRDRVTGAEIPEEYLPGVGGGRSGSSYPDLTFEGPNGDRIRVNTADTRADGTLTPREQRNFDRIFDQTGEPIIAIPKP